MLIHEITETQTIFKPTDYIEIEDMAEGGVSKKMLVNLIIPALGLANQQLFVNAAGDGLEYGYGSKVVAYTRDMTLGGGDVAYTGAGFKPRSMIILAGYMASLYISFGDIIASMFASGVRGTNLASVTTSTGILFRLIEDAAVTKSQDAVLKSMDADGCTLTWTKTGSPAAGTGYFAILYLR
jgi:hypothetical protein